MTEPLTPDQDKNRIGSLWHGAKTDRPMLSYTGRPAPPCHVAARIIPPSRSVMTSARGKTRPWRLIFERRTPPFIEPLMGYTGGGDTLTQVQLDFPTREAAIAFAERQKLDFVVQNSPPERPRPNVRKLLADPAPAFSHPDTRRRTTTNREAEMAAGGRYSAVPREAATPQSRARYRRSRHASRLQALPGLPAYSSTLMLYGTNGRSVTTGHRRPRPCLVEPA